MRYTLLLSLCASSIFAGQIYSSTGGPVAIPDSGSMTSSILVPTQLTVGDLRVTVNVTHTFDQDLSMWLVDPSGAYAVYLANRVGGNGDNFSGTVFDDHAATPIASGSAPFAGSYRPDGSLSAFNGLNAQGAWTLHVQDHAGGDVGTLDSWSMEIQQLSTYVSGDTPMYLPDVNTVVSYITVPRNIAMEDVNVRLNVTHEFVQDLSFALVDPSGSHVVQLAWRVGGNGDNFTNTVFDDQAATAIDAGSAPFTGSFRPAGSLSQLNGLNARGTWELHVTDHSGGDAGWLNSWGLDILGDVGDAETPEPTTLAALASGLLLLAVLRRKFPQLLRLT